MHKIKLIKANDLFPHVKELLKQEVRVRITVTGMSMYPFLRGNKDSVELKKTNFTDIKKGDIVLICRECGDYILHRVVKKDSSCFFIMGDAQQWIEGPLYPEQLQAKVAAIWRGNTRIDGSNIMLKLLTEAWDGLLPFRRMLIKILKRR
jgi:hypothetical protein